MRGQGSIAGTWHTDYPTKIVNENGNVGASETLTGTQKNASADGSFEGAELKFTARRAKPRW